MSDINSVKVILKLFMCKKNMQNTQIEKQRMCKRAHVCARYFFLK